MNARHIGDDFTSLLYIAVTSSVFLYQLPIREGGLDLSHPPPPTVLISHPRTSQLTVSVWGGGGLGSGGWAAPPPRHKLEG